MYSNTTSIGIMDEAYFVPKNQILQWIQKTIKLHVHAIEDLGTGAVYCQLLDVSFGQRVPMHKINWKAKFQYQFINNLKIFQQSMEKIGIAKKIDIEKLAKTKYADNLELIQWLKRYIELNGMISQDYKAEQRRSHVTLFSMNQNKKTLGNSFKGNNSILTNSISSINLPNIMYNSTKPKITSSRLCNKQNQPFSKKPSQSKLQTQLNEIKKILMTTQCSDNKIEKINKVVFGKEFAICKLEGIQAQLVESDEELCF